MKIITIDPKELAPRQNYLLLLGIIIPRPIGLISTLSNENIPNLAPFSYFQALSANPPAALFCPTRNREGVEKDSLRNVKANGEFVACTVTEEMAERMNLASAEFPENVSEFEKSGFTKAESKVVKPFGVMESPVCMECRVANIFEFPPNPLSGAVVVGEILRYHISENVLDQENLLIKPERYKLISRLGGSAYGRVENPFEMPRPKLDQEGNVIPGSFTKIELPKNE